MKTSSKILLGLIGGISATVLYSTFNTANVANKFDFKINYFKQKKGIKLKNILEDLVRLNFTKIIAHSDIVFDVGVSVQNPTNVDVTASHPYLKVFYKGMQIGNSTASESTHLIKANSVSNIDHIEITLAGISLFKVMPDYAKYLLSKFNGSKSKRTLLVRTLIELNGNAIQTDTEVNL